MGQQIKEPDWQDHGAVQFLDWRLRELAGHRFANAVINDVEAKLKLQGRDGLLPLEMAPIQPVGLAKSPRFIRQKAPLSGPSGRFYSLLPSDFRRGKLDFAAAADTVVSEGIAFLTRHASCVQDAHRLFAALSQKTAPPGFQLNEVAVLGTTDNHCRLLIEFSGYDDALRIVPHRFVGFFDYECEEGLALAMGKHEMRAELRQRLEAPQRGLSLSKAAQCVLVSFNLSVSVLLELMGEALSVLIRRRNTDETWIYAEFRFLDGVVHVDAHSFPETWRLRHNQMIIQDADVIPEAIISSSAGKPLRTLIGEDSSLGELQMLSAKRGRASSIEIQLEEAIVAASIDP